MRRSLVSVCGGALVLVVLTVSLACRQIASPLATVPPPRIVLNADSPRPTIDVIGVPNDVLTQLPAQTDADAWRDVLKVSNGSDPRALRGQYTIVDGIVRFTPMFPLDRGRPYRVTFAAPKTPPVTVTVSFPAADTVPTTSVNQVFPSAPTVPSNLLRLHVAFSAPMATRGVEGMVHLLDSTGTDRTDLLLPLEADSWNADLTRCTLIVNPAKPGSLLEGEIYTLSVEASWPDSHGLPLKQPFRRVFTIGPPDDAAIDPKGWKVELPQAGSNGSLVVFFPEPLDYESLSDALTVIGADKRSIGGHAVVGAGESTWTFVPDDPWQSGPHTLAVARTLVDLAGNTIGEMFDADTFDRSGLPDRREKVVIPITIR